MYWRQTSPNLIYLLVKIGQNTENSPGDLQRLAVTQTPVANAGVKNSPKSNNNNDNNYNDSK